MTAENKPPLTHLVDGMSVERDACRTGFDLDSADFTQGTYVSVEPFHLQAYCDEQAFRYDDRRFTDADRFALAMKNIVGRRITYNELIGKTEMETAGG